MQNKINKIKHTGVYVLVVDDYLYKTGDIFGEWVFLPMDSIVVQLSRQKSKLFIMN